MIQELKEQASQLGLTVRDFAQFALPGFVSLLGLGVWPVLPLLIEDPRILLSQAQHLGFVALIGIAILSYLTGQFLACATHVVDAVAQLLFRRRAFGVPFKLINANGDYRSTVHANAAERSSKELGAETAQLNDAIFDTLMEFMLYRVMTDKPPLFSDIQRHQAILYMRKHMVLAVWAWWPIAASFLTWWYAFALVLTVAMIFWTGYRRLFRRTFFERLPLAYLSIRHEATSS